MIDQYDLYALWNINKKICFESSGKREFLQNTKSKMLSYFNKKPTINLTKSGIKILIRIYYFCTLHWRSAQNCFIEEKIYRYFKIQIFNIPIPLYITFSNVNNILYLNVVLLIFITSHVIYTSESEAWETIKFVIHTTLSIQRPNKKPLRYFGIFDFEKNKYFYSYTRRMIVSLNYLSEPLVNLWKSERTPWIFPLVILSSPPYRRACVYCFDRLRVLPGGRGIRIRRRQRTRAFLGPGCR